VDLLGLVEVDSSSATATLLPSSKKSGSKDHFAVAKLVNHARVNRKTKKRGAVSCCVRLPVKEVVKSNT